MFVQLDGFVAHAVVDAPAPVMPADDVPLLMLHSIGTALAAFDPQAAALGVRRRVIRMDLRGHGLSGVTEGDYSMAQLATDALALLDALGVARAHVLGMSIGGRIALQMAATAPARVASLILLDTALEFAPASAWQDRIDTVMARGTAALVDVVMPRWVVDAARPDSQGLRQMLLRTAPAGYAGAAAALRDARAAEVQGRIACPATVVVGTQDIATPPALAQALAAAIPGSRYIEVAGGAHLISLEKAEETTALIEAHFAALPAGTPYEEGMAIRKSVLGEAHVARAQANLSPLDTAFQEWITANVWGGVWTRPGLPRHTRSLLTLGMMAALGRHEEFELHVRATRRTGVTPAEIAEVLLAVGAYAGVPAANSAFKIAKAALKED
jgi:3-oxoadipate enol-lactonase/4-carboxymuconolactone decarboxylase